MASPWPCRRSSRPASELRWLGPKTDGGYSRRAPLYFFEQRAGSDPSFVRHTSIWGGESSFLVAEISDGIEIVDVAGYDAQGGAGFMLFHTFHEDGCRFDSACAAIHYPYLGPRNVRFVDVLAAKVRGDGFSGYLAGPESGCVGCVAAGVFDNEDAAGFFQNNNIQVPVAPTALMKDSVAHNNQGNGVRFWQNGERGNLTHELTPWPNIQVWSNNVGLFLGAYANGYALGDISIEDSAKGTDFAVQAVPTDSGSTGTIRVDGATLGQLNFVAYVVVQSANQTYRNVHFNQASKVAVTQNHATCGSTTEENDPNSDMCFRAFFTLENPTFVAGGAKPFDFGWATNKHTTWRILGFLHADSPSLPKNFDLFRKDNQVAGGSYNASFDAWLVPR
jgi:hypothetical protein